MNLTLANYFVFDKVGEESTFPQMGKKPKSGQLSFQVVYWRCLTLYFWSARAFHPHASLVLFLNQEPPHEFQTFLSIWSAWNVDVRIVPFTHRPPKDVTSSFANSLYLLDVLEAASRDAHSRVWVFSDPDCIFRRSIEDDLKEVETQDSIFGLAVDYSDDYPVNGFSRRQILEFGKKEGYDMKDEIPLWIGGEFLAASSSTLQEMMPALLEIQGKNLRKWMSGDTALKTEEQLLSMFLGMKGVSVHKANAFVTRLWTSVKHRTAREYQDSVAMQQAHQGDKAIWHLPSEKRFGLRRVFNWLKRYNFQHSPELASEFLSRSSFECGVAPVTTSKHMMRLAEKFVRKITG